MDAVQSSKAENQAVARTHRIRPGSPRKVANREGDGEANHQAGNVSEVEDSRRDDT